MGTGGGWWGAGGPAGPCFRKPYNWAHAKFVEYAIEKFQRFFSIHFDKAFIKPSCCEISHHSFFFLGDILNYIRPYKLGDLFIPKTKHSLVFRQHYM